MSFATAFTGAALQMKPVVAARRPQAGGMSVQASQSLRGKVVSTATAKTAVVEVLTLNIHPIYKVRRGWDGLEGREPAVVPALQRDASPAHHHAVTLRQLCYNRQTQWTSDGRASARAGPCG